MKEKNQKQVIKHPSGFYSLKKKPKEKELFEYYSKKYYQDNKGSYEVQYSTEEYVYINNKIEQKYWILQKLLKNSNDGRTFLDIGCGEGFTLRYFKNKKWEITGIDYSDFGCMKFNPDCVSSLMIGDIYEQLIPLIKSFKKFDVIWLDNVLEHVLDPQNLLIECKKLLGKDGVLVVEVPNDFSVLQKYLIKKKHISSEFWVAVPDHISYFSNEGLSSLARDSGLKNEFTIADYPIDFNLVNPESNYIKDKSKGKNAHHARVEMDNLIHNISVAKAVDFYRSLADLGLGRQIISFFKHL